MHKTQARSEFFSTRRASLTLWDGLLLHRSKQIAWRVKRSCMQSMACPRHTHMCVCAFLAKQSRGLALPSWAEKLRNFIGRDNSACSPHMHHSATTCTVQYKSCSDVYCTVQKVLDSARVGDASVIEIFSP